MAGRRSIALARGARFLGRLFCFPAIAGLALSAMGSSVAGDRAWDDRSLPASQRAQLALDQFSQQEKLSLTHGVLGAPWGHEPKPAGAIGSAGYVAGVPRLGIPALQETDAELGIANPGNIRPGDTATAMPSDLALASTWDEALARRQGETVGAEARAKGFSVLLGGAVNLIRDPRGGRNFEYFSEDPLLSGTMAGAAVAGAQSRHVISTVKHFALNDQETDRVVLNAEIDRAAARESDLFAFEIALEGSRAGSVMCAYNQVDGAYSCENDWLLNHVLKGDWRYPGFVMSDWGAVHSTIASALAGLDQESGEQLDTRNFFDRPLAKAVEGGVVPQARLDDMARRILTSIFASGLYDDPPRRGPIDVAAGDRTALQIAREGLVLLKNDGVLPLANSARRLAVIGGHADKGVLSGGGSSQVVPRGGVALAEPSTRVEGDLIFDPSSPLEALRRQFRQTQIAYDDGRAPAEAAKLAATADAAIVFAYQWMTETADAPSLVLPRDQDRLIASVAAANPRTIVVLETGGPVLMPWLDRAAAVLEAWYPGQKGGEAIAEALSGAIDPAGRSPITFPRSEAQLPRPRVPGDPNAAPRGPVGRGGHYGRIFTADYSEGAAVGYKWFAQCRETPLFPFGFGLSYTRFALDDLTASANGDAVTISAQVRNIGARAGAAIPQFYLSGPPGAAIPLRLAGWSRIELQPGEERRATVSVDPRLFAHFDENGRRWRIAPGAYRITAGFDAAHPEQTTEVDLKGSDLPP
ncbi:MAG TPA: glycoside hydrolase family 3 C-terminal domain-containing protein [Roseiarcus sp.]|nr:glycoside hydrolase family 3 C-terminal domain-containing protein [Roseiarcus sp.]